ncbi:MAG: peroxiredoxin family protein [Planctomycetota bacterium]
MLLLLSILVTGVFDAQAVDARAQAAPAVQVQPIVSGDEAAFVELHKQFIARWSAYDDALRAARESGVPQASWPVGPQGEFFARFDALAKNGHPRAMRWCIQFANADGAAGEALRERKLALYGELARRFADEAWITEVLREVRAEVSSRALSAADVEDVCMAIARATNKPAIRAAALYNAGFALASSNGAGHAARGEALLDQLVAEHPDTDSAARARGKLYQLRNLQIGQIAPDFTTTDVDGVEFKLSDYRGKVVVLDFWGFW